MPVTPLIRSLSFVGFSFEYPGVGFDVSRFLTVVADLVVMGLAPASLVVQRSGRTSSLVVRSVNRTLHYISFLCRVFALHTIVTKVSQEEGRLLMSIMALSSSSIVVPCDVVVKKTVHKRNRCTGA